MFCPKCGNLLNDNEKYCRSCGAKVERSESKVNAPCDHSHGTTELPPVTLGEAVRLFFTRYVDFEGRSRRSEFWGAQLALWVCSGLVNLVLRNEQNIPRAQVVRRAFHDVRHPRGQAENDLVKIVVVRLEVQVALVGGMKKAVFLVEVPARAYALHGAPPFTSQTSCRSQGSSSASSRRTSSAGTQPIAR